jgi:hypothetical protein
MSYSIGTYDQDASNYMSQVDFYQNRAEEKVQQYKERGQQLMEGALIGVVPAFDVAKFAYQSVMNNPFLKEQAGKILADFQEGGLKQVGQGIVDRTTAAVNDTVDQLGEIADNTVQDVGGALSKGAATVSDTLGDAADEVTAIGSKAIAGASDTLTDAGGELTAIGTNTVSAVNDAMVSTGESLANTGTELTDFGSRAVGQASSDFGSMMNTATDDLSDTFQGAGEMLGKTAVNMDNAVSELGSQVGEDADQSIETIQDFRAAQEMGEGGDLLDEPWVSTTTISDDQSAMFEGAVPKIMSQAESMVGQADAGIQQAGAEIQAATNDAMVQTQAAATQVQAGINAGLNEAQAGVNAGLNEAQAEINAGVSQAGEALNTAAADTSAILQTAGEETLNVASKVVPIVATTVTDTAAEVSSTLGAAAASAAAVPGIGDAIGGIIAIGSLIAGIVEMVKGSSHHDEPPPMSAPVFENSDI